MEVLDLNRPLDNSAVGFVWLAATGAKEVKFSCLNNQGQFSSCREKVNATVDYVATCQDSSPAVDQLYEISFAMPVSKLRIEALFTGTVNLGASQVVLDLTKTDRSVTLISFKSPFPLSNFRLVINYTFDSLANQWSRFDYDYFVTNKVLAPYYKVSVLDCHRRDLVQLAVRDQGLSIVVMVVTSSDKRVTDHLVELKTR